MNESNLKTVMDKQLHKSFPSYFKGYTMKHKHHKEILAWANGAVIESLNCYGEWIFSLYPEWDESIEYRVQLKPNVEVLRCVIKDSEFKNVAENLRQFKRQVHI
jgi:hypothetical protein